jgi:hypothetical protein
MAKPICIVYVPVESGGVGGRKITWADCNQMSEHQLKEKPDYHWFFVPAYDIEKLEFKVFYEKDFTEIQYAELKDLINKAITNYQQ